MLHEASDGKPETVAKRVLVDQQVAATLQTGVGVVPLIGCQSGGETDNGVKQQRESQKERRQKERRGMLDLVF